GTHRCQAHHIYGNGGEGVLFTDTKDCLAHHIGVKTPPGVSPIIFENRHGDPGFSERNCATDPITHQSELGETPKVRNLGETGVNIALWYNDTTETLESL